MIASRFSGFSLPYIPFFEQGDETPFGFGVERKAGAPRQNNPLLLFALFRRSLQGKSKKN